MSTRGIIARTNNSEGQFIGRYHHSDSMPTELGAELWKLLHGHFRNDLPKLVHYLVDAPHAVCGWSDIVGKDFSLKPAYTWQKVLDKGLSFAQYSQLPDYRRPQCFAGRKHETEDTRTQDDLKDTDCEWLYVFDVEQRKLFIRDLRHDEDVAVIDLDGAEPKWEHVECGGPEENWRRCHHCAWVHGVVPKTCNLSMQTWLGNRPLDPIHDAVAYIIAGKKYKATGCGGTSDFIRGHHPRGTWVASVITGNNRRVELPIAQYIQDSGRGEYRLLNNVQPIYPPTARRAG
jgi:hypothetical protein